MREIERQIVRCLDGELSADEAAELQRRLLRDPRAQRMYEEYATVDAKASAALKAAAGAARPMEAWEVLARAGGEQAVAGGEPAAASGRRYSPGRLAWAGGGLAAAAAVVVAVAVWSAGRPGGEVAMVVTPTVQPGGPALVPGGAGLGPGGEDVSAGAGVFTNTSAPDATAGPQQGIRVIDDQWVPVYDEKLNQFRPMDVKRHQTQIRTISADL
jgi:hypothetical protein